MTEQYNTKYIAEATSDGGVDVKVEFQQLDYEFDAVPIVLTLVPEGVVLEYNNEDVIRGKTVDIEFDYPDDLDIKDIVENIINNNFRVKVSYDAEVVFIGFPDDSILDISTEYKENIKMVFTDGFRRLEETKFSNYQNVNLKLINYILSGLNSIGIDYDVYVNAHYYDINMNNITSTDTTLNRTYLNDIALNEGDGDGMNYYEIIEGILKSFNLKMYSLGDKIIIDENTSYIDESETKNFIKYEFGNIEGVLTSNISTSYHSINEIYPSSKIEYNIKKKGYEITTDRKVHNDDDTASIQSLVDDMNSNDEYFSTNCDRTNLFNQMPFKWYKHSYIDVNSLVGDTAFIGDVIDEDIYISSTLTEISGDQVAKVTVYGYIYDTDGVNFCRGIDNNSVLTIDGITYEIKTFRLTSKTTDLVVYNSDIDKLLELFKGGTIRAYKNVSIEITDCYLVSDVDEDEHIIMRPNTLTPNTLWSTNGVMGLYYNTFFKVDPFVGGQNIKVEVTGHFYNEFDLGNKRRTYLPLLFWLQVDGESPKFLKKNSDGIYYLSTDFKAVYDDDNMDSDSGLIKIREGVKEGVDQPFTVSKEVPVLSVYGISEIIDKEIKLGVVIGFPHRKKVPKIGDQGDGWEIDDNGNDYYCKIHKVSVDLPTPPEIDNVLEYYENDNIGYEIEKIEFPFGDIDSYKYRNGYCYDYEYSNRTTKWRRNVDGDSSGYLSLDDRYAQSKDFEIDNNIETFNFNFHGVNDNIIKEYDIINLEYGEYNKCTVQINSFSLLEDEYSAKLLKNVI